MLTLLGLVIILILVAYIIQVAAGALRIPAAIVRLLQLVLVLVFVIYLLSWLGILPAGWAWR